MDFDGSGRSLLRLRVRVSDSSTEPAPRPFRYSTSPALVVLVTAGGDALRNSALLQSLYDLPIDPPRTRGPLRGRAIPADKPCMFGGSGSSDEWYLCGEVVDPFDNLQGDRMPDAGRSWYRCRASTHRAGLLLVVGPHRRDNRGADRLRPDGSHGADHERQPGCPTNLDPPLAAHRRPLAPSPVSRGPHPGPTCG